MALLHAIAFIARLVGGLARQASSILIGLYDLFIMLPLGIETLISHSRPNRPASEKTRDSYVEEQL
jgi:hypothetical protein